MHDSDVSCELSCIVTVCRLDGHSQRSLTSMQAVAFCVLLPGHSTRTASQAAIDAQHYSAQCCWCMQAACSPAAAHLQPSDHHSPGNVKSADTPHLCICSYSPASQQGITHKQGQWGRHTALAEMLPAPLQLSLQNSAYTAQGLCY